MRSRLICGFQTITVYESELFFEEMSRTENCANGLIKLDNFSTVPILSQNIFLLLLRFNSEKFESYLTLCSHRRAGMSDREFRARIG
jgi:hypothetical protein